MKLKNLLLLFTLISGFAWQVTLSAEDAPPPADAPTVPEVPKPKANEPFNLCDFKVVSMEEIFTAATREGTQMGELEQITSSSNGKEEVVGVVFEKLVAFYQADVGEKLMASCKKTEPKQQQPENKTAI
jgi:hypothetical protein